MALHETRLGRGALGWLILLLMTVVSAAAQTPTSPETAASWQLYVIGHMTNTKETADWALLQGANGIEMDLRFDDAGNPSEFKHGFPCDCDCSCCDKSSVCGQLKSVYIRPCEASTPARDLLEHIAPNPRAALVVIDSKVESSMGEPKLRTAGTQVVKLLEETLFAKGFAGRVVVGAPKLDTYAYLEAAATQAQASQYAARFYFTIDGEGNDFKPVVDKLIQLPSPNRVYGTGISACGPGSFYDTISLASYNQQRGVLGLTYIWTLEKTSSMLDYIHAGAQGVMTNYPGDLFTLAQQEGIPLATTATGIPAATSSAVADKIEGACDCDYHPGGCSISQVAPKSLACKCKYKGAWTCGGSVVICRDQDSPFCAQPDTSIDSCLLGGGDCEGYKNVTCDCDYHPGGCSISQAAPKDTACQCKYKGAWTCGGTIVPCIDSASPFCAQPDTSIESCLQGGGDCEGYKTVTCDCDYHPGGCSISKAAPKDTACQCQYKGAWTCGGTIVRCADPDSAPCKSPDTSLPACLQGQGDCEGYKTATCDCDYHKGGCTISQAAPRDTACKCNYKGFWTCGGEIVKCTTPDSSYCKSPDTSPQSCLLGSGDCGGYK